MLIRIRAQFTPGFQVNDSDSRPRQGPALRIRDIAFQNRKTVK